MLARKVNWIASPLLCLSLCQATVQGAKTGFVEHTYKAPSGVERQDALFVPHGYTGDEAYPVILFLHGAGEREGGRKGPADVGIGPAIKKLGEKEFPFIVLFPRCSRRGRWQAGGPDAACAMAMLESVEQEYKTDKDRTYLTGLSLGGYGTWSLAAKFPNRWAAIVPICGGGNPDTAESIKHIPCWCFHGAADQVVPASRSTVMIDALKAVGGDPRYDEFPGVGHNSWDKAYGNPKLYEWLLELKRN